MLPCKPYLFLKRQNENSSHDFFFFSIFLGYVTPLTKGEKVYFSSKMFCQNFNSQALSKSAKQQIKCGPSYSKYYTPLLSKAYHCVPPHQSSKLDDCVMTYVCGWIIEKHTQHSKSRAGQCRRCAGDLTGLTGLRCRRLLTVQVSSIMQGLRNVQKIRGAGGLISTDYFCFYSLFLLAKKLRGRGELCPPPRIPCSGGPLMVRVQVALSTLRSPTGLLYHQQLCCNARIMALMGRRPGVELV